MTSFAYADPPAEVAASLQLAAGKEALHSRSVRTVDGVGLDLVQEWVPASSPAG